MREFSIDTVPKDGMINGFTVSEWIGFLEVDAENLKAIVNNPKHPFYRSDTNDKLEDIEKWITDLKTYLQPQLGDKNDET